MDRYKIDGKIQDTVIAVRELNPDGVGTNQQSWLNQHVVYTHGYGVVAAKGNKFTADGKPDFLQSGIPSTGVLGNDSDLPAADLLRRELARLLDRRRARRRNPPRAGPAAPARTARPTPSTPSPATAARTWAASSTGSSTPSSSSPSDLLLSDGVNAESQILYDRNPRERVEKVAPYLTVDGNAYPAVVDGRVKWIVDGYTTSRLLPVLAAASSCQRPPPTRRRRRARTVALPNSSVNYIRNSVKATVDAYDGSVHAVRLGRPGPGAEGLAEASSRPR